MNMKKEGKVAVMAALFLTSQLLLSDNLLPKVSASVNNTPEIAGVYSNNVYWIYKKENGKTYKRLYDEKNHKWISNWILVG